MSETVYSAKEVKKNCHTECEYMSSLTSGTTQHRPIRSVVTQDTNSELEHRYRATAPSAPGASSLSRLHDHTLDTPHSVGLLSTSDQPEAETSTWQHTTLTRETFKPPVGFETAIPVSKRLQTHALDLMYILYIVKGSAKVTWHWRQHFKHRVSSDFWITMYEYIHNVRTYTMYVIGGMFPDISKELFLRR
jgi:hypothetical protein